MHPNQVTVKHERASPFILHASIPECVQDICRVDRCPLVVACELIGAAIPKQNKRCNTIVSACRYTLTHIDAKYAPVCQVENEDARRTSIRSLHNANHFTPHRINESTHRSNDKSLFTRTRHNATHLRLLRDLHVLRQHRLDHALHARLHQTTHQYGRIR